MGEQGLRGIRRAKVAIVPQSAMQRAGLHAAPSFKGVSASQLSGGQRQRASIARAMALGASMLVADEPTSMLDASVGAGILNLLLDLSRDKKLGLLFITHNLAAARYVAERIVVLYRGQVVEEGPADVVINAPRHPYTEQLEAGHWARCIRPLASVERVR